MIEPEPTESPARPKRWLLRWLAIELTAGLLGLGVVIVGGSIIVLLLLVSALPWLGIVGLFVMVIAVVLYLEQAAMAGPRDLWRQSL